MKLLRNVEVLDEFIRKDIALKSSNQKKLVDLIKFHLKNGFLLKHNGNLHLQAACRVKKNNIVDFLIKTGADVNFRNPQGEYEINFAIRQFHTRVPTVSGFYMRSNVPHVCVLVDKLIQQGASLSMQDNRGRTVIHQWAFDEHFKFVPEYYNQMVLESLLQKSASVDLVDSEGNNALMCAALHNESLFMILLETTSKPPPLSRTFFLDQQNLAGENCAHLLAMQNHDITKNFNGIDVRTRADALQLLISKGVSLYVENNAGNTVIDCILNSPYGYDYNRKVLYKHTHECMMAFLMGTHSRLGAKSHVRHMDDIALDLILREIRNQLKSIILSMRHIDDE